MTDALLSYSITKMKEYGIVDSGDSSEVRYRCHDGCPLEKLLSTDGACWRRQAGHRLQARLHAAVRQQGVSASTCGRRIDRAESCAAYSAGTASTKCLCSLFPPHDQPAEMQYRGPTRRRIRSRRTCPSTSSPWHERAGSPDAVRIPDRTIQASPWRAFRSTSIDRRMQVIEHTEQ